MDEFLANAAEYGLPEHTAGGLARYVLHRIPPGGFLTAVLSNDMADAFGRADHENTRAMPAIVSFLHNEVPSTAWGSPEAVNEWLYHAAVA